MQLCKYPKRMRANISVPGSRQANMPTRRLYKREEDDEAFVENVASVWKRKMIRGFWVDLERELSLWTSCRGQARLFPLAEGAAAPQRGWRTVRRSPERTATGWQLENTGSGRLDGGLERHGRGQSPRIRGETTPPASMGVEEEKEMHNNSQPNVPTGDSGLRKVEDEIRSPIFAINTSRRTGGESRCSRFSLSPSTTASAPSWYV